MAPPGGDALEYLRLGHNLATGNGFSLSAHSPFHPTDWRMPGYPALLAVIHWLHLGDTGVVVLNSLLGALAVAAVLLVGRRVFADRPRSRLALGLAAALYPPLITYTGMAFSENLSIAAVSWLAYVAFFASFDREPTGVGSLSAGYLRPRYCSLREPRIVFVIVTLLVNRRGRAEFRGGLQRS